jgi:tape measure domain-containing protein
MALDLFNVRAILSGSVTGTDAFDRFGNKLNTVGKTADNVNRQMAGLSKGMNTLMSGLAGFSLANVIAEFARVTIQIDAYQKQLSIGFGGASILQLEQLRKTFRNLGISQDEALGSAVRFTSAMKLSGNTSAMVNKNFEAASKIVLANKLSADGANRVYYAMAQVASKGKLMSEELSGQLAENLAGIREQVAIALNMSSATLMEQMKEGKISAEQFFEALRKIGDGIDPATLNLSLIHI